MFVKICGITNEDDALLAVALGADAIGFVFAPSSRQIAPARAVEIARRVPGEVITVGVFRDEAPARVVQIMNKTGLRAAQLHGGETPETVAYIKEHVPLVIKAVVAGSDSLANAGRFGADAILVDAPSPGSGRVFDWSLAENAPKGLRLIMAGGLFPDNVAEAIAKVRPFGVDVSSGVERAPGLKDPRLLRDFINAARRARPAERGDAATDLDGDAPYDWQDDPTWR